MTFGPSHYVPVLKVKRGEKSALHAVSPNFRSRITPLLEIVVRTKPTVREHLDTAFKDLPECLQGFQRCFLDTREFLWTAHWPLKKRSAGHERMVFPLLQ